MTCKIILASSSLYRKNILAKLQLSFTCSYAQIDETAIDNETATDLVTRLSQAKVSAVAKQYPQALIIGSDQVVSFNQQIIGKPNNHHNAVKQLTMFAGNTVNFFTGLCLLNTATKNIQTKVVPFKVVFKKLSSQEIDNYLHQEQPYNCTGSFKSEGLGITLFDRLIGNDPNTLTGLPLIELTRMLIAEGVNPLDNINNN